MEVVTMPSVPVDRSDEAAISLLTQLLHNTRLFSKSVDYKALLDFTSRMRNFAPFNAMLLNIQKPGLLYAASQYDWQGRFKRTIKDGARPLLILWPFGPVALVYDVADTEGADLPEAVLNPFPAEGKIDEWEIESFAFLLGKNGIEVRYIEYGAGKAGSVQVHKIQEEPVIKNPSMDAKIPSRYIIRVNTAHNPNTQFATIAHELAHIFLGHLGKDPFLKIPARPRPAHDLAELEAESVSYLVCARNCVYSQSESYLVDFVKNNTTVDNLDHYTVMKAAGQVETALGLGERISFGLHARKGKRV
jgi:hypothetical protein